MNSALSRARRIVGSALAIALVATLVPAGAASAHTKPKKPQHQIKKVTKKSQRKIKNVIVLISDGMGYSQLAAGNLYSDGKLVSQGYERFPSRRYVHVRPPVRRRRIQPVDCLDDLRLRQGQPDRLCRGSDGNVDGCQDLQRRHRRRCEWQPVKHALEYAEERGKATGVVSTVEFSHATPAGFVAHNPSRNDYVGIANEMLKRSAVDVIMGAGHPFYDDSATTRTPVAANYNYVGGQATWDGLVAGVVGADADNDGDLDPFTLMQTKTQFEQLTTGKTPRRVVGVAQAHDTAAEPWRRQDGCRRRRSAQQQRSEPRDHDQGRAQRAGQRQGRPVPDGRGWRRRLGRARQPAGTHRSRSSRTSTPQLWPSPAGSRRTPTGTRRS